MIRTDWLRILAHADKDQLKTCWDNTNITLDSAQIKWLRQPEIGLLPLQARMGNSGDKFLFGDATLTRAVVEIDDKQGYAFVLGRDKASAECAAIIDALMQGETYADQIRTQILTPLAETTQATHAKQHAEVAETKVDFFTMVRGE